MRILLCLCVALAALAPLPGRATSFVPLGFLPGGTYSEIPAISGDGTTVVGRADSTGTAKEAFLWTATDGIQGLGTGGFARSVATSVSADGSVAVGYVQNTRGDAFPFRWTESDGLDLFLGSTSGIATDVSADGSVIIAGGRWTEAGGMVPLPPSGGSFGVGLVISADASVVAGFVGERFAHSRAAFWVGTGPAAEIGSQFSEAVDVSADGSVIVGNDGRPFRWTAASGSVPLCCFANPGDHAEAWAISADGSVIVGDLTLSLSSTPRAFVWDPVHGVRLLEDVLLADYGLSLPGWRLSAATGISADGQTLVGYGTDPGGRTEAWLLSLPEPGAGALVVAAALALAARRRLGRSSAPW